MSTLANGHEQVPIKVNAECDRGIAPLVSALNEIDGLITLDSCQEALAGESWVFFTYGDGWQSLSPLLQEISSGLGRANLCCGCTLRLEWVGSNERPRAQILVRPEHVGIVAAAIRQLSIHLNHHRYS